MTIVNIFFSPLVTSSYICGNLLPVMIGYAFIQTRSIALAPNIIRAAVWGLWHKIGGLGLPLDASGVHNIQPKVRGTLHLQAFYSGFRALTKLLASIMEFSSCCKYIEVKSHIIDDFKKYINHLI